MAKSTRLKYTFRAVHREGTIVHLLAHGTRALVDGDPVVVGIALDVTQQRRGEEGLRRTKHQYEALLDSIPDMAWLKDTESRLLACNEATLHFLDRPREEVLGRRNSDLFPPELAASYDEADARALREGRPISLETTATKSDGRLRTLETTKVPFRDGSGAWAGTAGIARDVTERRALEARLQHAQRMEAVGRLAGGVAHDFNNLLTAMHGHTRLALEDCPAEHPVREHLREIRRSADRAAALTRQLLAFSRKQVLRTVPVDLNALVRDLEKLLRRLIGEDVEVVTNLDPGLPMVKVDPGQIEQVLVNLAVNARDAMPSGGRLTITTAPALLTQAEVTETGVPSRGAYARLSVADTGTGIPPEVLPRIFEPFFTTKEQGKGTGLGLATAFGTIHQSGGHISAESEPGVGTVFHVLLPRTLEAAAPEPVLPRAQTAEAASASGTVLVVEDEAPIRKLISRVLGRRGYRVLTAATGEEALELMERETEAPVLVVTDVVMPGMDGLEMGHRLRRRRPGVPLLLMSGYAQEALEGELPGFDCAFLPKPFTPADLLDAVQTLIG